MALLRTRTPLHMAWLQIMAIRRSLRIHSSAWLVSVDNSRAHLRGKLPPENSLTIHSNKWHKSRLKTTSHLNLFKVLYHLHSRRAAHLLLCTVSRRASSHKMWIQTLKQRFLVLTSLQQVLSLPALRQGVHPTRPSTLSHSPLCLGKRSTTSMRWLLNLILASLCTNRLTLRWLKVCRWPLNAHQWSRIQQGWEERPVKTGLRQGHVGLGKTVLTSMGLIIRLISREENHLLKQNAVNSTTTSIASMEVTAISDTSTKSLASSWGTIMSWNSTAWRVSISTVSTKTSSLGPTKRTSPNCLFSSKFMTTIPLAPLQRHSLTTQSQSSQRTVPNHSSKSLLLSSTKLSKISTYEICHRNSRLRLIIQIMAKFLMSLARAGISLLKWQAPLMTRVAPLSLANLLSGRE